MSAWIVSEKQILTLAFFYEKMVKDSYKAGEPVNMEELKKTARILWAENTKSINYRYGGRERAHFTNSQLPDFKISMESLTKQIHCWEYQTCEHPGHRGSKAWRMMQELQCAILTALMYKHNAHTQIYDDARWGI